MMAGFDPSSYQNLLNFQKRAAAQFGPDWMNKNLYPVMGGYKEATAYTPMNPSNPLGETRQPKAQVWHGNADGGYWEEGDAPGDPFGWDKNLYGRYSDYSNTDVLPGGQPVQAYLDQLKGFDWPNYSSAPSMDDSIGGFLKDAIASPGIAPVLMAAGAGQFFGGGAGAASPGWTSGYDLAGGGSLGQGLGGSNVGFFDDILGDWTSGFDLPGGGDPFGGMSGFDPSFNDTSVFGPADGVQITPYDPSLSGVPGLGNSLISGTPLSGNSNILSQLKNALTSGNSSQQNAAKSLLDALGIDAGSLLGQGLNLAASVGPSLAAINYARNLGGPDTSRLESAYSSIDPNALALPYDIQTGKGRDSLTSSLTSRGVMGSSFGNQDLESYDTLRGLGRQNLLTSGVGQQASIASQILAAQTAQQKNKLDLYGRSLLALSGGLKGSAF